MNPLLKLIPFIALVYAIGFSRSVAKSTPDGTVNSESLTGLEKFNVWLLDIVNPVLHGAIFYFSWRKKLPIKAKQANKVSFIVFGIEIVLAIALVFFLSSHGTTTSPTQIVSYHSNEYQFTVDFPGQPKVDKSENEAGFSASYTANRTLEQGTAIYYVQVIGEPNPFTPDKLKSITTERVDEDFHNIEPVHYELGKAYENYTGTTYEYIVYSDKNRLHLRGMAFIEPKNNRVYVIAVLFDEALSSYMTTNYQAYLNSFSLQ